MTGALICTGLVDGWLLAVLLDRLCAENGIAAGALVLGEAADMDDRFARARKLSDQLKPSIGLAINKLSSLAYGTVTIHRTYH